MTPEEINRRIATWAGLDSHVCDGWSFHCDDCERGIIQTPDYYRSNSAMDLLGVLVERGYSVELQTGSGGNWCEIWVDDDSDTRVGVSQNQPTIPAAICTAILKLSEREKSHVEM